MRRACWSGSTLAWAVAIGVTAAGAIALTARAGVTREIRIASRNMTFYVEGRADPNPTLRLRRGEDVRLVFRNEDPGIGHAFAVPGWGVTTRLMKGTSETSITFRAPERPTRTAYQCVPHAAMMNGTIVVE